MSVAEAKARLWALADEHDRSRVPGASFLLPAAALGLGFMLMRRRHRGPGLLGLAALAANPTVRSLGFALAGAALRRFTNPRAR